MKKKLHLNSLFKFFILAFLLFTFKSEAQVYGTYFNHISSTSNSAGDYTILSHPSLDNSPNAQCIVTPIYNPNGVYNNFNIGVWYTGTNWSVYNEDAATPIPDGSSYNVLVPSSNGNLFQHFSQTPNIVANWSYIFDGIANNNPDALVFFSHNWSISNLYNNKVMGVWYDASIGQWAIYNEDQSAFQANDYFNVFVVNPSSNAFVHQANSSNIISNWTVISDPMLDGNPNAIIFASHNWSAFNNGVYSNHPIGVWYDGANWTVYNQDLAPMDNNASFNILISNVNVGVNENAGNNNYIKLFPTITSDMINVDFFNKSASDVNITIYNSLGQEMKTIYHGNLEVGTQHFEASLKDLESGIYIVRVLTNNKLISNKIILSK